MAFKLKGWSAFSKPETQNFMGKNQLINRLSAQDGDEELAKNILIKRGDMNNDGSLTLKGQTRDNMTAEERALDRAAKESGKPVSNFSYDPTTNSTKLI